MSSTSIQSIPNHPLPSLFVSPPAKLTPFLQAAFDKIRNGGFSGSFIVAGLKKDIANIGLLPPSDSDFYRWIIDVQTCKAVRPSNVTPIDRGFKPVSQLSLDEQIQQSLKKARGVVRSFYAFIEHRNCVDLDQKAKAPIDGAVSHAIRLLMTADANKHEMPTTPANRLIDLLLSHSDAALDQRLAEIISRELQVEVCSILVKRGYVRENDERVVA